MRPCFNPGVFFIVLIALAPAHGRDVYGNATPWTNSDTIIWELHQKQNAFVPPVSSGPSWQAQLSARASQKQFQAENAAREAVEAKAVAARVAERAKNYRPLTWAQEMERYIMQQGDRAKDEQEQLAFYYVDNDNLPAARRHLEMAIFRKSRRAGEAAWHLYRLHAPQGPAPDPRAAADYLEKASVLGYGEGRWNLALARVRGDSARGIAPDPIGAQPELHAIMAGEDGRLAIRAARLLLERDRETPSPASDAHALVVLRRLVAMAPRTNDIRDNDYLALALSLVQSPGSWGEHSAEIMRSLQAILIDSDGLSLLAQVYLGLDPMVAAHVAPEPDRAHRPLATLARQSRSTADGLLAQILPRGPKQRLPQATTLLVALIENNPNEQGYLQRYAEVLAGDFGGTPNPAAALGHFEKLAAQPQASPAILVATARLLSMDLPGKPPDFARAFLLYERAAEAHEPYAQYRYAEALLRGKGRPADSVRAREYLRSATASNRPKPPAYPLYALCAEAMRESTTTDTTLLRAAWAQASMPERFPPAQLEFARCVRALFSISDVGAIDDADRHEAFVRAKLAAEAGLDGSRMLLAQFYREGFGTETNLAAAHAIYADGAKAGVPMAMAALSALQLDSTTPFHDAAAGFALAERAAALGDPHGLFLLGRCHLAGQGTPTNAARAAALLARSAAGGNVEAMPLAADVLLSATTSTSANYAQAVQYLRSAADAGNLDAAVRLLSVLATDPARAPDSFGELFKGSRPEDEARGRDYDNVVGAVMRIEQLTGKISDPARAYATAIWFLGEPVSFAPFVGLKFFSQTVWEQAAQGGHLLAAYRLGLREIAVARGYLKRPEADALALKDGDSNFSDGHLAQALDYLRVAAVGGNPAAAALLKARDIAITAPQRTDAFDRVSVDKLKAGEVVEAHLLSASGL